ncbi:MAG: DUF6419 family natural product biosynthesis protein [Pseudoalteromonas spongiae]|uniref:DUF6419 family natural product biosynthesis protein n=1 Tax=Pseudoalteromonas TaxID=53246 RepID=UPI000C2D3FA1|nr:MULTISPECIES: DUF6419 family natural product biosynthesis protein [Pseudoalteromonas]MEC8326666.1 DUF6419 family natural product biosynthesis protein [Pseudomonadota bacterium]
MYKIVIGLVIALSLVVGVIAAAAFTPALGFTFLFLIFAGVIGYQGYLLSALMLVFINTLAILASPGIANATLSSLAMLAGIFSVAFGGVMLGVKKQLALGSS